MIENDLDQSQIHTFVLRSLQRLEKEDEFLKVINQMKLLKLVIKNPL